MLNHNSQNFFPIDYLSEYEIYNVNDACIALLKLFIVISAEKLNAVLLLADANHDQAHEVIFWKRNLI
ncbi:hypothetical protein DLR60_12350 [Vibrio tarriae]|nr:hypothetical protein DLR58_17335 [Vibrio tarriae]RBM32684.1 hypothetical protein DLR61_00805 [Vibrio tarriae]RBM35297.1 hypothetical protein DLR63_16250 [Vibrio tarriae]RBM42432.1 hypothetical protein DLR62_03785 [Vibrio tarriae]RBM49693.1 hypothetical protein DLR64_13595 [Vibrio tarriae]